MRVFEKPPILQCAKGETWRTAKKPNYPVIIEIGAGVGFHAIDYCKRHFHCTYLAIEKTSLKFQKFQTRLNHHSTLSHLLPIQANACNWIAQYILSNEVDQYFILYPNPYPKKKQANKRWFRMPFMSYLIETLKPGGSITLATNDEPYCEEAKVYGTKIWDLQLFEFSILHNSHQARTHFEKKYLERGETCFNLVFQKPSF